MNTSHFGEWGRISVAAAKASSPPSVLTEKEMKNRHSISTICMTSNQLSPIKKRVSQKKVMLALSHYSIERRETQGKTMTVMYHGKGRMAPPPSSWNGTGMNNKMAMHMTFFWGNNTEVLFWGWPDMYVLALIFVFVLSVLVEWLSSCQLIKSGTNNVAAGLGQTVMHAIRVGLAYIVMLVVMSFKGGVFLTAVAGHSVGFLLFGSRVFKKSEMPLNDKRSDLPTMKC